MTSLLGCSGEDFASVLRALNYRCERRPAPSRPHGRGDTGGDRSTSAETIAADAPAVAETPLHCPSRPRRSPPRPRPAATADMADVTPKSRSHRMTTRSLPERPPRAGNPRGYDRSTRRNGIPGESTPICRSMSVPADSTARRHLPRGDAALPDAGGENPADRCRRPTAQTAAAASPAEPAFIEIWRPARPDRHGPRREPRRDRREGREARPRPPRGQPAQVVPANGGSPAAPAPPEEQPRRERDRRPDKPDRHERHADRPRPQNPPRPERREKPIDPNSPFAALAALKAELEARKRDG